MLFERMFHIRTFNTMFGTVEIVKIKDGQGTNVRVMKIDRSYQSATYCGRSWMKPPFRYIAAFDHIFEADDAFEERTGHRISRIAMIGGGGFSYPKHLLTSREAVSIDVVEIDPTIVDIARKHFYLDKLEDYLRMNDREDDLGIFIQDGMEFFSNAEKMYDAIIVDSFEGGQISERFLSPEGIASIKDHLQEGGMIAINVIADLTTGGAHEIHELVKALGERFDSVYVIDASDEDFGGADNFIMIASDVRYTFSDLIPFD